ncbi:hypothetical protein HII36_34375 [Nonomuraea sp. NN258]|uniref:hypothetical protein n=1 Tax=Nonomuraea antri TaxID=2730852 RepID=UPI0015685C56|nr:hypothetical protein [Nonomuraea antri]NRQ36888.1 hypothetical protein [Nonomuraea antri]
MTSVPDQRFVRFRQPGTRAGAVVTLTFLSAPDGGAPSGDPPYDDVLARLDPRRAERIRAAMRLLVERDDAVMSWLEADPANAALFAADPVAAVRRAQPDLPEDFFDGWSDGQRQPV